MVLMIMSEMQGKVTIQRMWEIATGQLPRPVQWELGIIRPDGRGGVKELTPKQIYDMGEKLSQHLSWTSTDALALSDDQAWHRWAAVIMERGVQLVHDLRADDHGSVDYEGAKIIAGWPHCPGTPEHFDRVERPGVMASKEEHAAFRVSIQERWRFAMQRRKRLGTDGKTRWTCPAKAGKVGCPFVQDSVASARELGQPTVVPPEAPTKFCEQETVQIEAGKQMKYAQEEYWGSSAWETSWNRRTYVEGVYGNLKNPNTENIHRGFFQFVGMPLVTLALTGAVVSYNIREYNSWHERTGAGDPDHPLLKQTDWVHGFEMRTQEQAKAIDDEQTRRCEAA